MARQADEKFPVQVACAPARALHFEALAGSERLSEPYAYDVTVLSEDGELRADAILGHPSSVTIELPQGGKRIFHGLVSSLVHTGESVIGYREAVRLHRYRLRLQPWLWFLTRAADCRIFQKEKTPDIVKKVFQAHGFSDFELKLQRTYEPREYCVQYRETDFNFVSRLLQESGIFYYFQHHASKHVMVLADDPSAHQSAPHYSEVHLRLGEGPRKALDSLESWWVERAVQSGSYATTDFDFRAPATSLLKTRDRPRTHERGNLKVYDYPALPEGLGGMPEDRGGAPIAKVATAVQRIAEMRLQELQAAHERFHGRGACLGLVTGSKFKLIKGQQAAGHEYAIVATEYSITSNRFVSGPSEGEYEVSAGVEATEAKTVFRPPRLSPKPLIQGAQTAIVVGRHGEEIDADKWGRVKVQFHWDREGQKDENSSCWVRVAQVWAGKNWGAMHIPRIGQEVLVEFLEGDPDRPIITGRVYNNDMMPPYTLPENLTQSGIKSRSSKQGGDEDYNEIRFEDKKGSEQLLVHAQKDMLTEVEHDKTLTVGHDSTTKVKHDSITEIENDRKLTITHDETCTVKNDHSTNIQGKEKRDVTGKRTTTIADDDALTVNANAKRDIAQNYTLKAGQQITLETGASRLVMKSDGTIQLEGVQLTIKGSVKIELNTLQFKLEGTMVQLQGTNTQVQATMLQLQGSAMATLKGAITMIG